MKERFFTEAVPFAKFIIKRSDIIGFDIVQQEDGTEIVRVTYGDRPYPIMEQNAQEM